MSEFIKRERRQFVMASVAAAGGMLLASRAQAATPSAAQGDALKPAQVPIRFRVTDASVRLHLPVQFGPWNYTYYRGS